MYSVQNRLGYIVSVLFFLMTQQLCSQPLEIHVNGIDQSNLPLIRLDVCITRAGIAVPQPGKGSFTLMENGVSMLPVVDCPDTAVINSLALALDNSGSMASYMFSLRAAAMRLVDSLPAGDEAALIAFGQGVAVLQGFTTDKNLLRSALNGMNASGGTPFYDACLLAVQMLSSRPGRKAAVLLTDGIDNASSVGPGNVMDAARASNIKLFTIGFGTSALSESQLRRMAMETGGKYFRVLREEELAQVFDAIAVAIMSRCCQLTYLATSCEDSVRALRLEVNLDGETAAADTMVFSPYRPDTLRLVVDAPSAVGPNGNAIVYVRLEPRVDPGMLLSFSFRIRYNPGLLTVFPVVPITIGTITQNRTVFLSMPRPGILEFSASYVNPSFATGNLVGVRFKGVPADSSRPVEISLEDVQFAAGCPNVVYTEPDTIEVCQCREKVTAWLDSLRITRAAEEISMPVYVQWPDSSAGPALFISMVNYNPDVFTPVRVDVEGTSTQYADVSWDVLSPGLLRVATEPAFSPTSAEALYRVVFRVEPVKSTEEGWFTLPTVKMYARCCPETGADTSGRVLVEGMCEKISSRSDGGFALGQNAPNPANPVTTIIFSVGATHAEGAKPETIPVLLTLFDVGGREIARIVDASMQPGTYRVVLNATSLPSGTYFYRLSSGGRVLSRSMTVVK